MDNVVKDSSGSWTVCYTIMFEWSYGSLHLGQFMEDWRFVCNAVESILQSSGKSWTPVSVLY